MKTEMKKRKLKARWALTLILALLTAQTAWAADLTYWLNKENKKNLIGFTARNKGEHASVISNISFE